MKTFVTLLVCLFMSVNVFAKDVVPKVGSCPAGYSTQGNYCVAVRQEKQSIPKKGPCPAGWSTQGNYCVKG
jgi:hypothetical protein